MSNIEQITNELFMIDSYILDHDVNLQREAGEISATISKTQGTFGDQQPGQELVAVLYKTLQNISCAEGALAMARQDIRSCIQNLQN